MDKIRIFLKLTRKPIRSPKRDNENESLGHRAALVSKSSLLMRTMMLVRIGYGTTNIPTWQVPLRIKVNSTVHGDFVPIPRQLSTFSVMLDWLIADC